MWRTLYRGNVVLPPKHARLFRDTVEFLSDTLIGWEDFEDGLLEVGVEAFDRLTQAQKQVMLLRVSRALLLSEVEPPEPTSVVEATVDAIYESMHHLITIHIDEPSLGGDPRRLVLEAVDEMGYWEDLEDGLLSGEEPESPPSADSTDDDEWRELVGALRDAVMDDADHDMEDMFVDHDPEAAAALKEWMGIPQDYYDEVPDDPMGAALEEVRVALYDLLDQSSVGSG